MFENLKKFKFLGFDIQFGQDYNCIYMSVCVCSPQQTPDLLNSVTQGSGFDQIYFYQNFWQILTLKFSGTNII